MARKLGQSLVSLLFSYGFLIVSFMLILLFSIFAPNFFTLKNGLFILHAAAPTAVLASGVAFVLMTGKIDISIGSIAYLSAGVGGWLMMHANVNPAVGVLVIFILGAILGGINGFITIVLRVNPLITTLGTMFIFRGLGLQLMNSMIISIPDSLGNVTSAQIGPIFPDILVAAILLTFFQILLSRTVFGRHVMAIGNSADVAKKVGVAVDRISFMTFVLSGLMASIGGALTTFQVGVINPAMGDGYEFTAIAVLVIGGVSLFGGEGTIVPGILLGTLIITLIQSGLNFLGASVYIYPVARGGIIFVAMCADLLKRKSISAPVGIRH